MGDDKKKGGWKGCQKKLRETKKDREIGRYL